LEFPNGFNRQGEAGHKLTFSAKGKEPVKTRADRGFLPARFQGVFGQYLTDARGVSGDEAA
jgi:hypothetical protein